MFHINADFQSYILLIILVTIGYFSKNDAVQIAAIFILVLKALPFGDKYLPLVDQYGLRIGIIILTIGVFAGIGLNRVTFEHMKDAVLTYKGWTAIIIGVVSTILATNGVKLMEGQTHLTSFIILGTILGVGLFKGTAIGPLIASGILSVVYMLFDHFIK